MNDQQERHVVPAGYDIGYSMFVFFLIFLVVSTIVEMLWGPADLGLNLEPGWHAKVLVELVVASGCAALVYGIVMSVLGRRLPDTWIGEAILVFVIFYAIWIVLQWISDWGITGTYAVRGLVYGVISTIIVVIISMLIASSKQRAAS